MTVATVASAEPAAAPSEPTEPSSIASPEASGTHARREGQRLFVLGEFGWNSIAGVGMVGGYHLHRHFSVEAGAGFSPVKWKFGVRARANLFTGEWTPFASAGFAYGLGDPSAEALWLGGGAAFRYNLLRSPYALVGAGVDYTGDDGVVFLVNVGWSFLLSENVRILRGTPTDTQRSLMQLAFQSGPIVALAFGYAF